jgi:hypothetical protein
MTLDLTAAPKAFGKATVTLDLMRETTGIMWRG